MQQPFLDNPRRRRRRSGPKGHKRGCACFACKPKRHHGRRRHSRNPGGIVYGLNKRRRKGARRHHRRHYRRNPGGGGSMIGELKAAIPKVGWGVVGGLATEAIPMFAQRFIPLPQTRTGAIAVKGISGIGVAYLVRRFFGRPAGDAALIGALLTLVVGPVRDYVLPMIGGIPLLPAAEGAGAYLPDGMGAYLPDAGAGYLGPAPTMGAFEEDSGVPARLTVDERF
jgi:hypothetical protein